MERTLLIIKPDGVQRGLIGEVIKRIEKKAFKIVALKMLKLTPEQASALYLPHKGKSFYEPTVKFMSSSPIVAVVLEGRNCINLIRKLIGGTRPEDAKPGSIRGDFATSVQLNIVHASDTEENARREIEIIFSPEDLCDYSLISEQWTGIKWEAGMVT